MSDDDGWMDMCFHTREAAQRNSFRCSQPKKISYYVHFLSVCVTAITRNLIFGNQFMATGAVDLSVCERAAKEDKRDGTSWRI